MKKIIRIVGQFTAIDIIIAITLGFLGQIHPAFDTAAQFRLHLSVCLLLGTVILLVFGSKKLAIVTLLVGAIGFYSASSGTILTARTQEPDQSKPVYSMFHMNLLWNNREKERVLRRIRELDPEIISVTEQGGKWRELFLAMHDVWPYQFQCRQGGQQSATSIYSKWKMDESSKYCGEFASVARVDVRTPNGENLTVVSTHFRWPWPASGPRQLENAIPQLKTFGKDALVTGDFNATTWSWAVRRFAAAGGLSIVPGIGSTWMAGFNPLEDQFWLGLPIDNAMQKGNVSVLSAKVLEKMGSDHLPILVEFQFQD